MTQELTGGILLLSVGSVEDDIEVNKVEIGKRLVGTGLDRGVQVGRHLLDWSAQTLACSAAWGRQRSDGRAYIHVGGKEQNGSGLKVFRHDNLGIIAIVVLADSDLGGGELNQLGRDPTVRFGVFLVLVEMGADGRAAEVRHLGAAELGGFDCRWSAPAALAAEARG